MTLDEYQKEAMKFAKYGTPDYPFIALSEEVGEVSGKIAKYSREHGISACDVVYICRGAGNVSLYDDVIKELGDSLWQLQACCSELGVNLGYVAQLNIDKLSGRLERGTIVGEGDER